MPTTKYLVHCEKPHCHLNFTVNTVEEQQRWINQHKCPYWGGESKVSWSVTKTLVQQMWEKLDAELDELKGRWRDGEWVKGTDVSADYHKYRARAMAECIAIFMTPFFETPDDIAREALRRWEARRDSDAEYETPGIGHRRYESAAVAHLSATPGWYGTAQDGYTDNPAMAGAASKRRVNRGGAAPAPVKIRLSEETQEAIRAAHQQMPQIFTVATLAKQYGATEAEVAAILKA